MSVLIGGLRLRLLSRSWRSPFRFLEQQDRESRAAAGTSQYAVHHPGPPDTLHEPSMAQAEGTCHQERLDSTLGGRPNRLLMDT